MRRWRRRRGLGCGSSYSPQPTTSRRKLSKLRQRGPAAKAFFWWIFSCENASVSSNFHNFNRPIGKKCSNCSIAGAKQYRKTIFFSGGAVGTGALPLWTGVGAYVLDSQSVMFHFFCFLWKHKIELRLKWWPYVQLIVYSKMLVYFSTVLAMA